MKILFFTKSKKYTNRLLRELVETGDDVNIVCKDYQSFDDSEMKKYCKLNNINYYDNNDLYSALEKGELPQYDLAVSNTYGKLIKKDIIDWVNGKIFNLHGAILPQYKGMFTYNWGLYNLEKEWGVTAHYINERFDEGDIIAVSKFKINPMDITISELESKTQEAAYNLSLSIIHDFRIGKIPKGNNQVNEGKYYSRKDFEKLKQIYPSDSSDVIERKIHACWCPPYEGAFIEINGERYYLVNKKILENL